MMLRLRWKSGLAMVLTVAMVLALAPPMAFAQEGQNVAQVVITGNQNVNRETIANVVKLAPGSTYTKDVVEKDRTAINALGYFSAVSVKTEDTPEGLRVIYDVVENPVVKDIKIVGSDPIPELKIRSLLITQPNQVLNTTTLNTDIDAIQRYYSDQGYIAIVTEDIGIDKETGVLTIPILVHTVENIKIVGNKKTKEIVFLREMKTKPGQVFNVKTLREDIARIYNLDIVDDIQTPKIDPGSKIGTVDITIAVTEKKTGQVSVGLGYSSQSRLVGRAEIAETNFRGMGQGLTALWETAASSTGSNTGSTSSYDLGFVEPWIDKRHTSLSMNVFNKLLYRFSSGLPGGSGTINGQTYNERRKGGSLGLSRPLTDFTRAFLTFRAEAVRTSNINDVIPEGETDMPTSLAENGPIRSVTTRFLNNTRDFDKDPATGWYRSLSLELGTTDVTETFTTLDANGEIVKGSDGKAVVSTNQLNGAFQKTQIDIRHYWSKGGKKVSPTDKRTTIAARLLGGFANGQIPFFEQYFVGGGDSLRGYREDRFWGNKMLVASVEYRRPVAQSLTGVLFADYGDAWGSTSGFEIEGLPQTSGFSPNLGVGVGLRVNTPIGNLRLDYGIGKDGARTHFSIGHAF